jgi:nickel/cobalt transporter (NicO) family protein
MKRLFLLAVLGYLAFPAAAVAHPLGNFTVNHFARVQTAGDRVYVRYVVDMAEIPTLQGLKPRVDGLDLRVDGRRELLRVVRTSLTHPPGAAGLRTTRFSAILSGPRVDERTRVTLDDRADPERIGWREIVVGARTHSTSDELRAYPRDLLRSPLHVTHVSATLSPSDDAPPALGRSVAPPRVEDRFASLVVRSHLSPLVVLASLGLAVFWGAAHALSPGHGKAIVTAYLVGSRGTPAHAALLGLITTVTHTAGVFALGGVTLLLSQWIVPEQLYPWIDLVAGLMVVGVGVAVLAGRARHAHSHRHGHEHHHHDHDHSPRGLFAVGVSGGLLPCPSALVVLLGAITLHRVAFGLLLVIAFSIGLALTITGVGLVALLAKRRLAQIGGHRRVTAILPAVSALVIVLAGAAMTVRALPRLSL